MRSIKKAVIALVVAIASVPLILMLLTAVNGRQDINGQEHSNRDFGVSNIEADISQAPLPASEATPVPEITPTPEAVTSPHPEETTSPSQVQETPAPVPLPQLLAVAGINKIDPVLSEALDGISKTYNCISVSLAFFDGDDTFYTYQYGMADVADMRRVNEYTKFRVASLSKIIPAICALNLAEAGSIDIDEDISVYLGYTVRNPNYPDTPITPRMLMQHTSTIYDSDAFSASRRRLNETETSTRDLLEAGTSFTNGKPGTGFRYSNFGTSVLGAVCETAAGKLLDDLAREILFYPLGIDAAYTPVNLQYTGNIASIYNANYRAERPVKVQLDVVSSGEPGRDHHLAQGNLTISAVDYARILYMLCNGGIYGDTRILSEETVNEMHAADVKGPAYMQGLSVRYQESAFLGEDVYWHTGSAYGELTQFIYNYETGKIAVVLTTGSNSKRLPNGMVEVCTELAKQVWDCSGG